MEADTTASCKINYNDHSLVELNTPSHSVNGIDDDATANTELNKQTNFLACNGTSTTAKISPNNGDAVNAAENCDRIDDGSKTKKRQKNIKAITNSSLTNDIVSSVATELSNISISSTNTANTTTSNECCLDHRSDSSDNETLHQQHIESAEKSSLIDVVDRADIQQTNTIVESDEKHEQNDYDDLSSVSNSSPVTYISYESEHQMSDIMKLIQKDLSEPYSIYTYRYFIHNWPNLCFLAKCKGESVGAIVCKLDVHRKVINRGYIAMLAVDESYRKHGIGSNLVLKAIRVMAEQGAHEVVLETEITNRPALRLYENLGFVRDKRLFRYYLNGVDALRLKLWLKSTNNINKV